MQQKTRRKHNAARLFFICCLIEYTARQTKNMRSDVVNALGKYSLQGTTQGNGLTGGVPPVRFSM